MYVYTSKGYQFVEYDEPNPPSQPRCKRCHAFMSKEPTFETRDYYVTLDFDEAVGQNVPRLATEEEIEKKRYSWIEYGKPFWVCGRCGEEHTAEEAYPC